MTDQRKSGIALIAGSLGGMLTMAIHPTASGSITVDQANHLAAVSGIAHSLALVSVLLLFLGAFGLARHLASEDRFSFSALVTFGLACVAIMIAASVSGFIVPNILKHMLRDDASAAHQWRIAIDSIFQINQAFSKIYSVATSLAIILWSVAAFRNGGLSRALAVYGIAISALIIAGIVAGHLRLDVHGMTIVAFTHALWFLLAAARLCRHTPPPAHSGI
jgi:heme A synthase